MEGLETYFTGEESWLQFAAIFESGIPKPSQQLIRLCGDDLALARVVEHHYSGQAIAWMQKKVSALNELKPIECVNDPILLQRLKVCLMRHPN